MQKAVWTLLLGLVLQPAFAQVGINAFPSRHDVAANETFTVTAVIHNGSAQAIANASVTSMVPAQFGSVTNLPPDAACASPCRGGSLITWTLGSLPANAVYVASYKSQLTTSPAPAPGGLVNATFQLVSASQMLASATTPVRVRPSAARHAHRLGASSLVVRPDERLALTATYANLSTSTVTLNNTLTLLIPPGLNVVDAGGGTMAGQTVSWNLGALDPGESGDRTVLVDVATGAAPGLLLVQSNLQGSNEDTQGRYVLAVNRDPVLRVALESDSQTVERSRQFAVRVRATNAGSTSAHQVLVTARLPQAASGPVVQYADGDCPSGCGFDREVRWSIDTLLPGESRVFSFSATTTSSSTGIGAIGQSLRIEAFAQAGARRAMASNDLRLVDSRELEAALDAPERWVFGRATRLRVLGANRRASPALDARLILQLPPGVSVLDADGGLHSNGRLEWSLGALAAGRTATRRPIVQAEPLRSGPLAAELFHDGFEDEAGGDGGGGGLLDAPVDTALLLAELADASGVQTQATQSIVLREAAAAVDLSLSIGASPALSGDVVNGEIALGNPGPARFGVKVYLRMPEEAYSYWGFHGDGLSTCTSSSVCNDGGYVVWDVGDLPAGATRLLSFGLELNTSAAVIPTAGPIEFEAWSVDATGFDLARARDVVPVAAARSLDLAVEDVRDPVRDGESLEYRLSYGNASAGTLLGTTLSVRLPHGATFVQASDGGSHADGVVTWNIGALGPGASGQRTLRATPPPLVRGRVLVAEAALAESGGNAAFATSSTLQQQAADRPLNLQMALSPDVVARDRFVQGELTLGNSGTDLFGVKVYLRMPQEADSYWEFIGDGTTTCTSSSICGDGGYALWDIGDLPAGVTRSLGFAVRLNNSSNYPPSGSLVEFDAWATEATGAHAVRTRSIVRVGNRTLDLAIEDDRDPVLAGETLTYTLSYGNASASTRTGAMLSLPIPQGTSLVSAGAGATVDDGVVSWNLGSLAPGDFGQRQLRLSVGAGSPATIISTTARLSDASGDTSYAEASTARAAQRPLELALALTPHGVTRAGIVNGELTLGNPGADLFGVKVYLRMPDEADSYWGFGGDGLSTCTSSSLCGDGGYAVWDVGDLPAASSRALSFSLEMNNSSGFPASGTLAEFEAWATEATGSAFRRVRNVVAVTEAKILDVAVEDQRDPAISGDAIAYTLSFGNASAGTLTGTSLSMNLPPGTSFASASDGGTHSGGVVTWNLGSLSPGASGQRTLELNLPQANAGQVLEATAVATDAAANVAIADVTTAQANQAPVLLDLAISPGLQARGGTLTGQITLNNTGGPLFGVVLNLRVPQETHSWTLGQGGTCTNSCGDGERAVWQLGDLAAGEVRVLDFSALLNNSSGYPPSGSLVEFEAWLDELTQLDMARAREVIRVQ